MNTLQPHHPQQCQHLMSVTARPADVFVRGEGAWLIDRAGERWLDYTSGIGVVNTGHAHPKVAAAIAEQANQTAKKPAAKSARGRTGKTTPEQRDAVLARIAVTTDRAAACRVADLVVEAVPKYGPPGGDAESAPGEASPDAAAAEPAAETSDDTKPSSGKPDKNVQE